jgi:hypothetical protein
VLWAATRGDSSSDEHNDWRVGDPLHWIWEVIPSPWLWERYEYEKTHYGQTYEWTGNVDEMLRDFSHYVFSFHDQFVEVLAAGIWFETLDDFDSEAVCVKHPLRDLTRPTEPDVLIANGIACEIWPNTRPVEQILEDAKLCSQKLLQFALVLDGAARAGCTLTVRVRHVEVKSTLRPHFGRVSATFDGVAGLEDARPYLGVDQKSERTPAGDGKIVVFRSGRFIQYFPST